MSESKVPIYNIGDLVWIRRWEDLAKEYRVRHENDGDVIDCPFSFTYPMRKLCGELARVKNIVADDKHIVYYLQGNDGKDWNWNFSKEMLIPYDPKKDKENGLLNRLVKHIMKGREQQFKNNQFE